MSTDPSKYGAYAEFITILGFTLAASWAVASAPFGKLDKWRPWKDDLPGTEKGIILIAETALFVLCFFLIRPDNSLLFLLIAIVLGFAAVVDYLFYGYNISLYKYTKPVPRKILWLVKVRDVLVIGGDVLTPAAKAKHDAGADIQQLLKEAEHNPDVIWDRKPRMKKVNLIKILFLTLMLSGSLSIALACLFAEVKLTGEAPAERAARTYADAQAKPAKKSPIPGMNK